MMRRVKTCPEDFRGFVSIPTGDGTTIDMVDFERIHGARALDDMLAPEGMTLRRDAKPGEPILAVYLTRSGSRVSAAGARRDQ